MTIVATAHDRRRERLESPAACEWGHNSERLSEGYLHSLFGCCGRNLYLRTASDKSAHGLTATQFRDELDVYSKSQVDSLLAGKANVGHAHGISLYSGTAGDPPHEHLVQGTTGIDQ